MSREGSENVEGRQWQPTWMWRSLLARSPGRAMHAWRCLADAETPFSLLRAVNLMTSALLQTLSRWSSLLEVEQLPRLLRHLPKAGGGCSRSTPRPWARCADEGHDPTKEMTCGGGLAGLIISLIARCVQDGRGLAVPRVVLGGRDHEGPQDLLLPSRLRIEPLL